MKRFRLFFVIFLVALIGMISTGCSGGILLKLDVESALKRSLGLHQPSEAILVIDGREQYPIDAITVKEPELIFEVIAPVIPDHAPYEIKYYYAGREYSYPIRKQKWSGGRYRYSYGKLTGPEGTEGDLIIEIYYYQVVNELDQYGNLVTRRIYKSTPDVRSSYTVYFPDRYRR
mgnify:CR=1 FL=1